LPVLVGPSTAVTPAPGARSFANVDEDDEKAMFYWVSASPGFERVFRKSGYRFCDRNTRKEISVSVCDASEVAA
jgi:hypothetical protein